MFPPAIGKISLCVEISGFVEASPNSHANLGVMNGLGLSLTNAIGIAGCVKHVSSRIPLLCCTVDLSIRWTAWIEFRSSEVTAKTLKYESVCHTDYFF